MKLKKRQESAFLNAKMLDELNGVKFNIVGVYEQPNPFRDGEMREIMEVSGSDGLIRTVNLGAKMINKLMELYGDETDKWKEKDVNFVANEVIFGNGQKKLILGIA